MGGHEWLSGGYRVTISTAYKSRWLDSLVSARNSQAMTMRREEGASATQSRHSPNALCTSDKAFGGLPHEPATEKRLTIAGHSICEITNLSRLRM